MKLSEKRYNEKTCCRTLSAILLWVTPLLLLIPNIALDITEISYCGMDRTINIILPLGVYFFLMSLSPKVGRTVLFFIPLMILCAFQIVLLFLYGESIIAIDMFLNVATTNYHEATELLRNLSMAIVVVCVIYLPPIILATALCIQHARLENGMRFPAKSLGIVLILVGIVLGIIAMAKYEYKPLRKLFPANVISNMVTAFGRTAETEEYHKNSHDFTFDAESLRPDSVPEIYVMVIGETSRSDNWQLNGYKRDTNPHLSHRHGLVSCKKALTESNTTHKSVPLLMSHLNADCFGDSIYEVKGIIDAFKEAGYETAWFSNQKRNHSLIDFFGEVADSAVFITDDNRPHYDGELCEHLHDFLCGDECKKFIVLHTYGSHFNYRERYPQAYNKYQPDDATEATPENRDNLINAYDNTILYTDDVIDSIISTIAAENVPAALIYMADHGEDIYDDDRGRFLHASPTPTYWQLHVPLLIWMSDAYRSQFPEKYTSLLINSGKNVSTSRSAFHTMVSLAGLDTPCYEAEADLSEETYVEPARVYLNDYDESVDFSEAGLRNEDFKAFATARIATN